MNEHIHRWLDGELAYHELPEHLRGEADRWQAVLDGRAGENASAPAWLESRVMDRLPARRRGRLRRALEWATRPRTIRVRPLPTAALVAAAVAALLMWPGAPGESTGPAPGEVPTAGVTLASDAGEAAADARAVYVQFVYIAPYASTVSVAGDFNEWSNEGSPLRDPDGDGTWTGYIPLTRGLHKYMFVVDGEWVTDPRAERHVEDGFGNRNALISVVPPRSAI